MRSFVTFLLLVGACGSVDLPPTPKDLVVTAVAGDTVTLAWTGIPPLGDRFTGHIIRRAPTSGGPYTDLAKGVREAMYVDKLGFGKKAFYVVAAEGKGGRSSNTAEVTAATVPDKPRNPHLASKRSDGSTLTWDRGEGVTSWRVEQRFTPEDFVRWSTDVTEPSAFVTEGLYCVVAINAAGESERSDFVTGVRLPPVPTEVRVDANGPTSLRLSWRWGNAGVVVLRDGVKVATVLRASDPTSPPRGEFVDTGLVTGKTYAYAVDGFEVEGGELSDHSNPVEGTPRRFTQISSLTDSTCVLNDAGAVYCWGVNNGADFGEKYALGPSANAFESIPVQAATDIVDLAVGQANACAVKVDGRVVCWGSNAGGKGGQDDVAKALESPQFVPSVDGGASTLGGMKHVAVGRRTSCAWGDGALACWGRNDTGELGDGGVASPRSSRPVLVLDAAGAHGIGDVAEVVVGSYNGCARKPDGAVWCWGYDAPMLGDARAMHPTDAKVHALLPVRVVGVDGTTPLVATRLFGGESTACATLADETLVCWGAVVPGAWTPKADYPYYFRSNENPSTPLPVPDEARTGLLKGVDAMAFSTGRACAHTTADKVLCWGNDPFLTFQSGVSVFVWTPTLLADRDGVPVTAQAVALGARHTCIRTLDGTHRCWGDCDKGRCGNGGDPTRDDVNVPPL